MLKNCFCLGVRSSIQVLINVFWHWVNLRIEFLLNLDHVLLVFFGYQVDSQTDLSESSTSPNSVQIGTSFSGEVEVDNNIDWRYIDTSGNKIRSNKRLKLTLSETFKHPGSLLRFHTWMQVPVLILLFVEFLRQELSSLVRPAKDNALVDDQFRVQLVNSLHLVSFIQEHVVMGETNEHEFLHQVDDLCFWHELLLEGLDSNWECSWVHEKCAFWIQVADEFFDIPLKVSLQQSVSFIQHKEFAFRE